MTNFIKTIMASNLYGFSVADYIVSKALDIGTGMLWDKIGKLVHERQESPECQLYDAIEASIKIYTDGTYVDDEHIATCCELIYGSWILEGCVVEEKLKQALSKVDYRYTADRKTGYWYRLFYAEIQKREMLYKWFQVYSISNINRHQIEIKQSIQDLKERIIIREATGESEKEKKRVFYEESLKKQVLMPVMNEEFNLKDIYVSLYGKLDKRNEINSEPSVIVDTTSYVMDWFSSEQSKLLCIHGEPGSGKSSLMKMVAATVCSIEELNYIVVFIDLYKVPFSAKKSALDTVKTYICEHMPWFLENKQNKRRLLILDGLDEIKCDVYNTARELMQELENCSWEIPCKIIVSGRTQVMLKTISDIRCEELRILHLLYDEDDFGIHTQNISDPHEFFSYDLRKDFWEILINHFGVKQEMPILNNRFNELSKSPLLLFLVVWTIKHTDVQFELLKNTAELYEKIFRCIYTREYNRNSKVDFHFKSAEYKEYHQMLHHLGICAYRHNSRAVNIKNIYDYCEQLKCTELCENWIQKHKNDNPSKLVLLFFLRERQNDMDWKNSEIEFIHKTFYEYLAAVAIIEILFKYTDMFSGETFQWLLFYIFSENVITEEIIQFIKEIIENKSLEVDGTIIDDEVWKKMVEFILAYGYGKDYPVVIGELKNNSNKVYAESYLKLIERVRIYESSIRAIVKCYADIRQKESDYINLNNIVFYNLNMLDWNLSGISFEDSIFSEGILSGSTFNNCNMNHLICGDVIADRTTFSNVNFEKADFTFVELAASNFTGNMFVGTIFQSAMLEGAYFTDAVFKNINFEGANLTASNFDDAVFDGVNFSYADLTRADLSRVIIKDTIWTDCIMENAKLDGVKMIQFDLNNVNIKEMLVEADLSNADWTGVDEKTIQEYLTYMG